MNNITHLLVYIYSSFWVWGEQFKSLLGVQEAQKSQTLWLRLCSPLGALSHSTANCADCTLTCTVLTFYSASWFLFSHGPVIYCGHVVISSSSVLWTSFDSPLDQRTPTLNGSTQRWYILQLQSGLWAERQTLCILPQIPLDYSTCFHASEC